MLVYIYKFNISYVYQVNNVHKNCHKKKIKKLLERNQSARTTTFLNLKPNSQIFVCITEKNQACLITKWTELFSKADEASLYPKNWFSPIYIPLLSTVLSNLQNPVNI